MTSAPVPVITEESAGSSQTRREVLIKTDSTDVTHPFGIRVFGSATLRVPPDSVTITAAINRLEQTPSEAFARVREAEQAITGFLRKARVSESGLSRIYLSQQFRIVNNERQSIGYQAKIGLTVALSQLDQMENVVSGLVEAGANEITSTEFHTSELRELRARVRRLAMDAARQKAETYAAAGHLLLGEILHVQDVDPNSFRRVFHLAAGKGQIQEDAVEGVSGKGSLDPSAIQVGAAVVVVYQIKSSTVAHDLATLGGTMPELGNIPRRRTSGAKARRKSGR